MPIDNLPFINLPQDLTLLPLLHDYRDISTGVMQLPPGANWASIGNGESLFGSHDTNDNVSIEVVKHTNENVVAICYRCMNNHIDFEVNYKYAREIFDKCRVKFDPELKAPIYVLTGMLSGQSLAAAIVNNLSDVEKVYAFGIDPISIPINLLYGITFLEANTAFSDFYTEYFHSYFPNQNNTVPALPNSPDELFNHECFSYYPKFNWVLTQLNTKDTDHYNFQKLQEKLQHRINNSHIFNFISAPNFLSQLGNNYQISLNTAALNAIYSQHQNNEASAYDRFMELGGIVGTATWQTGLAIGVTTLLGPTTPYILATVGGGAFAGNVPQVTGWVYKNYDYLRSNLFKTSQTYQQNFQNGIITGPIQYADIRLPPVFIKQHPQTALEHCAYDAFVGNVADYGLQAWVGATEDKLGLLSFLNLNSEFIRSDFRYRNPDYIKSQLEQCIRTAIKERYQDFMELCKKATDHPDLYEFVKPGWFQLFRNTSTFAPYSKLQFAKELNLYLTTSDLTPSQQRRLFTELLESFEKERRDKLEKITALPLTQAEKDAIIVNHALQMQGLHAGTSILAMSAKYIFKDPQLANNIAYIGEQSAQLFNLYKSFFDPGYMAAARNSGGMAGLAACAGPSGPLLFALIAIPMALQIIDHFISQSTPTREEIIIDMLKSFGKGLEVINNKLDIVLKNQVTLLNLLREVQLQLCSMHQNVMRELSTLKGMIGDFRGVYTQQIISVNRNNLKFIERKIKLMDPSKSRADQIEYLNALNMFYQHALFTAKTPVHLTRVPDAVDEHESVTNTRIRALINAKQIDRAIGLIPDIQSLFENTKDLQVVNPTDWSEATILFIKTMAMYPQLSNHLYAAFLEDLYQAGQNIAAMVNCVDTQTNPNKLYLKFNAVYLEEVSDNIKNHMQGSNTSVKAHIAAMRSLSRPQFTYCGFSLVTGENVNHLANFQLPDVDNIEQELRFVLIDYNRCILDDTAYQDLLNHWRTGASPIIWYADMKNARIYKSSSVIDTMSSTFGKTVRGDLPTGSWRSSPYCKNLHWKLVHTPLTFHFTQGPFDGFSFKYYEDTLLLADFSTVPNIGIFGKALAWTDIPDWELYVKRNIKIIKFNLDEVLHELQSLALQRGITTRILPDCIDENGWIPSANRFITFHEFIYLQGLKVHSYHVENVIKNLISPLRDEINAVQRNFNHYYRIKDFFEKVAALTNLPVGASLYNAQIPLEIKPERVLVKDLITLFQPSFSLSGTGNPTIKTYSIDNRNYDLPAENILRVNFGNVQTPYDKFDDTFQTIKENISKNLTFTERTSPIGQIYRITFVDPILGLIVSYCHQYDLDLSVFAGTTKAERDYFYTTQEFQQLIKYYFNKNRQGDSFRHAFLQCRKDQTNTFLKILRGRIILLTRGKRKHDPKLFILDIKKTEKIAILIEHQDNTLKKIVFLGYHQSHLARNIIDVFIKLYSMTHLSKEAIEERIVYYPYRISYNADPLALPFLINLLGHVIDNDKIPKTSLSDNRTIDLCRRRKDDLDHLSKRVNPKISNIQFIDEQVSNYQPGDLLDLSSRFFSKEELSYLVEKLKTNIVERLSLSHNGIDVDMFQVLIPLIRGGNLHELILDNNHLGDIGIALLVEACRQNDYYGFQRLSFKANGIKILGARGIVHLITRCEQLTHVDVSHNAITYEGIRSLLASLRNHQQMTSLQFKCNSYQAELINEIAPRLLDLALGAKTLSVRTQIIKDLVKQGALHCDRPYAVLRYLNRPNADQQLDQELLEKKELFCRFHQLSQNRFYQAAQDAYNSIRDEVNPAMAVSTAAFVVTASAVTYLAYRGGIFSHRVNINDGATYPKDPSINRSNRGPSAM